MFTDAFTSCIIIIIIKVFGMSQGNLYYQLLVENYIRGDKIIELFTVLSRKFLPNIIVIALLTYFCCFNGMFSL